MTLVQSTKLILEGRSLTAEEMGAVFAEIFLSDPDASDIKNFLVALHQRGENADEVFGATKFLQDHGQNVTTKSTGLFDCCGTGGDGKNTFNVSTAVAFVLAGGGVKVAKHGNRAVSSSSGSADVFEKLGVNINLKGEESARCVDELGIGFFFAPTHYPFLRKVAMIRKSIPHRTIFNLLGPLINPAGATHQLLGVADPRFVPIHAAVLKRLGSKAAIVVSSEDGLDEFTLSAKSRLAKLADGKISGEIFDPWKETGYPRCHLPALQGHGPAKNALRLKKCLKGHSEAIDHVVHINAAWGFVVAGKAKGFMEGLLLAQESVSSGRAYEKLEELRELSQSL